jgi:hypothetical protein
VPWGIEQSESFLVEGEVQFGELSCFSVLSFFGDDIGDACLLPGLHFVFHRILSVSEYFLFVDFIEFFQDVADESRLACIDVSDKDDARVLIS